MFSFACIVVILLMLAIVFLIIRRAGRSNASGTHDGGAYNSGDSYIIGGTPIGMNESSYSSDSSSETFSGFGGGDDFGGGGSGGDFGGGDSGGGDSGGGGDGGGGE